MKKLLIMILVMGLLLSSNAFALSYVCDWGEVYEIKNNKVYVDGKLKDHTYLKVKSNTVEFKYSFKGTFGKATIHHKANFDTGKGFKVFSMPKVQNRSTIGKCEKV